MNRKSLNHNMDREEKDATKSRRSPADFPLGSLQSRVAARIMQEEKALHARNDASKSMQLVLPGSFRIRRDRCIGCGIGQRRRTISGGTRG